VKLSASCNGLVPCRSTVAHPSCGAAVPLAAECCRGRTGFPWPPQPTGNRLAQLLAQLPPVANLTTHDAPRLLWLGLGRGAPLREGVAAPFRRAWRPRAASCALVDPSSTAESVREWLDHHRCVRCSCLLFVKPVAQIAHDHRASALRVRSSPGSCCAASATPWRRRCQAPLQVHRHCAAPRSTCAPCPSLNGCTNGCASQIYRFCRYIGVSRAVLYTRAGAPHVALKGYAGFAIWRHLPADVSDADASVRIRRECLQRHQEQFAFVTYLTTLEYIVVRGQRENARGSLAAVLAQRDLRYAPGTFWQHLVQPADVLLEEANLARQPAVLFT
jgi:hypothetical protein